MIPMIKPSITLGDWDSHDTMSFEIEAETVYMSFMSFNRQSLSDLKVLTSSQLKLIAQDIRKVKRRWIPLARHQET